MITIYAVKDYADFMSKIHEEFKMSADEMAICPTPTSLAWGTAKYKEYHIYYFERNGISYIGGCNIVKWEGFLLNPGLLHPQDDIDMNGLSIDETGKILYIKEKSWNKRQIELPEIVWNS